MTISVGIDIHKKTSTFYALLEDGEPWTEFNSQFRRVPSTKDGYLEVAAYIGGRDCNFLMENSTKTHDSYWILHSLGFENLHVAHAADLKRITKSDKKNDDNDATILATYMRVKLLNVDQFRCCYICTHEEMMDRRLCRIAKQEMMEAGRLTRRVRAEFLLFGTGCPYDIDTKMAHEWMMRHHDPALAALGRAMEDSRIRQRDLEKTIESRFSGKPIYEKLRSIPGFGVVTSAYLDSIIVDIDRFDNAKELASYIGIVPRQRDSGETESHCRITKTGDPNARWLLIQAVFRLVSTQAEDSDLKEFFNRKNGGSIAERKEQGLRPEYSRLALVASANKLCRILFALLTHPERTW